MHSKDIMVDKLYKSFGDKVVLSGFSARFPYGKNSSIMAASGKGKTTLLRILMGLEIQDSGIISGLQGKKIAMVFQEDRLCETLSAYVNIAVASGAKKQDIEQGLCQMGLREEIYAPVSTLSGGMKRRVAILRALLFKSEIILLDEPFKGLDEETKKQTIELVKMYADGRTLLVVTHSKEEQEAMNTVYNCTF